MATKKHYINLIRWSCIVDSFNSHYFIRIIVIYLLAQNVTPWVANLYVDEEYRNKGVARILLKKINEIAKMSVNFDELYLFTKHIGLYEKFGWEYISELDTHIKNPRFQRLYKLNIK